MAVELMMGYEGDRGGGSREGTVEEAALAGLRSMERLIGLLSQHCQEQQERQERQEVAVDCQEAVAAVTKFRKVISLLGRTRTGHARFRRAPPSVAAAPQLSLQERQQMQRLRVEEPAAVAERESQSERKMKEEEVASAETEGPVKVYCPKPIQQRLPPLPHHHQNHHHHPHLHPHQHPHQRLLPAASAGNSRASSLMSGDAATTAMGASSVSSFQVRAPALSAGGVGLPPVSSSSPLPLKRKCGTRSEDGATLCNGSTTGGPSGKCHCTKRR